MISGIATALGWIPLGDRLIIKMDDPLDMKGGVHIPEKHQQRGLEGVVLAVGPGFMDMFGKTHPILVEVGDRIMYAKYAGSTVKIDDQEYLLLSEKDIHAVKEQLPSGL
jgi:chaperonin GroES